MKRATEKAMQLHAFHTTVSYHQQRTNPESLIVAAVARHEMDRGIEALCQAGFSLDRIQVIVVEEIPRLEEVIGGSGLHRFLVRLLLMRGDDLDDMELARRELMNGRALIQVTVSGHDEQCLALSVLGVPNPAWPVISAMPDDPATVPPTGMGGTRGMFGEGIRPLSEGWNPVVNEIRQDRLPITL
jgi:hypothetical protein